MRTPVNGRLMPLSRPGLGAPVPFADRIPRGGVAVLGARAARRSSSRASTAHRRSNVADSASSFGVRSRFQQAQCQFQSLLLRRHIVRFARAVAERESLNRNRATAACSTISLAQPISTVGMPFASIWRATRLEVWWQTGQFGTTMTASTVSSRTRAEFPARPFRWLRDGCDWSAHHETGRDPADAARGGGAAQRRQREPTVAVGRRRVDAVVANVGDPQIVILARIA